MINIKSSREIELMRKTCRLASQTLDYIAPFVNPGVSTLKLNDLCHQFIVEKGAYPSPLNYHGFPKSICTSKNEVVCHGIPSGKEIVKEGDILNIDVTTFLNEFHGDTSMMFFIGEVDPKLKKLVEVTYECLWRGIREVRPGEKFGNIGAVIEEYAHDHGYSVVEEYCGHGIGRKFHEEPQVLHYGKRGTGATFRPGMIFTIEPMINLGKKQTELMKDKWTVLTRDRSYSAQYEHTILVTEEGYEVLTLRPSEKI